MARSFTPSRSAIYGSPDRQAMIGVANTIQGALQDYSEAEIQGEYRRQTSNASVAMERERQSLVQFMRDNQKDPSSWKKQFAQNREKIRKGILDGITQPQAKQAAELELNESLQQWEGWISDNAAKQIAVNTNADYETGLADFYRTKQFADETDAMTHLSAGLTHIEGGYNGGSMPVDSLPTQAAAEAEKRKLARQILGDYGLQQALAGGNEEWIDNLNERAKGIFDSEEPLFSPEDMAKIQDRYKKAAATARAEAKAKTDAANLELERAANKDILTGRFTYKNEKGEEVNWRQTILDSNMDPGTVRTLVEKYDARINAQNKTDLYDDAKTSQARIEIWSETDPKKQFDLLFKHAAGLGEKETEKLREQIFDPVVNFTPVASDLNTKMKAIRAVQTDKEKDAKLTWLQDQLLRQLEAHPEWTTKQQTEAVEAGLAIVRNEAGKEAVKSVGMWSVNMSYGRWYPQQTQTEQAPAGLEKHWQALTPERRQKVKNLLAKGIPLNRIIEALDK